MCIRDRLYAHLTHAIGLNDVCDGLVHHRGLLADVTAENTTIASESLSGEITGKTYEAKKIHP